MSDCLYAVVYLIIFNIMKCIGWALCWIVLLCARNAHAFPDGISIGVGASMLGGINVLAGYRYMDSSSWLGKFGARFDFSDTGPLKSAIDSAIDHIMSNGVDVGDGVKIDNGELDSSHYAMLVDFYPFNSGWRLTGGLMWGNLALDAAIKGEIAEIPSERFYFYINGDHYYYNGNSFRGDTSIDWKFYGPYLGTGFDIGLFCGVRLFMDIGAVVTNRPARLSLSIPHEQLYIYDMETATWSPVTVPKLDSDVASAQRDANRKLSDLRVYPVLKLGFLYRF